MLQTLFFLFAAAVILLYLSGIRFYVVLTGSMSPAIPAGSLCVVNQNTPFSEIQPGDVISFRVGGDMLVTHRAVKISSTEIVTKGDANNAEETVTPENYAGKTVWSIPRLGSIVTFLKSRYGIVLVGILFLLLLLPLFRTKEQE